MRLLDLFCGAGGATRGYQLAGFEVTGVDIEYQPRYCGDEFVWDDAIQMLMYGDLDRFDVIHASPPCQRHVKGMRAANVAMGRVEDEAYVDLIPRTRELLKLTGKPYVIENVVGAPLIDPVRCCGSSFGLDVRRHRLFESNQPLRSSLCDHASQRGRYQSQDTKVAYSSVVQVYGSSHTDMKLWGPAMGIDWMDTYELREAIPPAYTEFIGGQLVRA